jgi:hypothetical protein
MIACRYRCLGSSQYTFRRQKCDQAGWPYLQISFGIVTKLLGAPGTTEVKNLAAMLDPALGLGRIHHHSAYRIFLQLIL